MFERVADRIITISSAKKAKIKFGLFILYSKEKNKLFISQELIIL